MILKFVPQNVGSPGSSAVVDGVKSLERVSFLWSCNMGVSKNRGTPKWMESSIKMDDLGVPLFSETAICTQLLTFKKLQKLLVCFF